MKKFFKLLPLVMVLALSLALIPGCGETKQSPAPAGDKPAQAAGKYKPGTYTASAEGIHGPIEVEVKFSADKIESITVKKQNETEGIGSIAVAELPKKIVEAQSLAVDGISGATKSSDAIFAAVADCVKQAGGDVEALKAAGSNAGAKKEEKQLEADLVVVGAGGSGMTATVRATELGLKTIVVEKMPFMGGAISISGGNQVVTGSELQKQEGVTDDSPASMVEDFKKNGDNLNVNDLIELYAKNVGETTNWLDQTVGVHYQKGLHKLAEYSHNRELAYEGGGAGAAKVLREKVNASGAQVLLNTRATDLIVGSDGKIEGVKASNEKTAYTIKAKAVLLSTGGYGNNKDMLSDEMKNALYYGPVSSTGDGIKMATAKGIDAATRLMEYGKRYPNGVEVAKGKAKSTIVANYAGFKESAILVNKEGKRVVNEKASNRQILEAELKQPDSMLYVLMDAATFDIYKSKLPDTGISEKDVDTYLASNGKSTPVFAHAKTLKELAGIVGMDPATLENTVKTYNGYVEAGKDAEFGRSPEYMTKKIGDGPYYLVEQKPRFATTMGGLVVNTSLEVMNKSDKVIPNLYASGETVGGVMGDDSPSGANNGWAVTSGKLAAESIAKKIKG